MPRADSAGEYEAVREGVERLGIAVTPKEEVGQVAVSERCLLGQVVLECEPERVALQRERFLGTVASAYDQRLRPQSSHKLLRKPQRLRESQDELRRLASLVVVAVERERHSEPGCDLDNVLVRFVGGYRGESSFQARAGLFDAAGRRLDLGEA